MALIICPECGKEISDKVKACPHCGYPFTLETEQSVSNNAPQQVEVVSVKVNPQKTKKIIICSIIAVVLIAVCALAVIMINRQKEIAVQQERAAIRATYIENLELARSTMLIGCAEAEKLCNLTKSVWYNTIYEKSDKTTDAYTKNSYSGKFNDDFNTSIANLYHDSDTKATVARIKGNQEEVAEIMRDLQNPPDDLSSCFETIEAMYDIYSSFTSLAVSPSGNYNSYSENSRTYGNDFVRLYDKLNTQIPSE